MRADPIAFHIKRLCWRNTRNETTSPIPVTSSTTDGGWFTNYENYGGGGIGIALVSEQFCKDNDFTLEENGRIAISANNGKQMEVYDKLIQDVKLLQAG